MPEWMRGKGLTSGPSLRRSLLALAFWAGVLTIGVAAGLAQTRADAVLNVTYIGSSSLQVRLGDGTAVRSGGTIPAGSYQVLVDDPDDANPSFRMTGPGVSIINNDLNSSGMGIDRPATFGPFTLATSSTYTLQDSNIGASSTVTLNTSATATASGSSNTTTSSTSSGSSTTPSGGKSSSSSGTSATKSIGTLTASVSTTGKPALMFGGKAVKTLKAGRYAVKIQDNSKRVGLIVWKLGSHPLTLSGAAAIGPKSQSVTFSSGKWFFEASTSGPKTYFTVS
jgi:hypothetical protein